jgi:hypothetical protein
MLATTNHSLTNMMEPSPLDEYKEAGINFRHYSTQFAALFGVFIAITAGLISVAFGAKQADSTFTQIALRVFGVIQTLFLWICMESANYLFGCFIRRAAELEKDMNFKQYSQLPGAPGFHLRPSAWATRVLFILSLMFWVISLVSYLGTH